MNGAQNLYQKLAQTWTKLPGIPSMIVGNKYLFLLAGKLEWVVTFGMILAVCSCDHLSFLTGIFENFKREGI